MAIHFPPEPLIELVERRLGPVVQLPDNTRDGATSTNMAQECGVSRRQIERWRNGKPLTAWAADRVATSLGVHPEAIWPYWFDVSLVEHAARNDRRRERKAAHA